MTKTEGVVDSAISYDDSVEWSELSGDGDAIVEVWKARFGPKGGPLTIIL